MGDKYDSVKDKRMGMENHTTKCMLNSVVWIIEMCKCNAEKITEINLSLSSFILGFYQSPLDG